MGEEDEEDEERKDGERRHCDKFVFGTPHDIRQCLLLSVSVFLTR